jgi:hypothetical protein
MLTDAATVGLYLLKGRGKSLTSCWQCILKQRTSMVLLELQGLIERTLKHRVNLICDLFVIFNREKIIY